MMAAVIAVAAWRAGDGVFRLHLGTALAVTIAASSFLAWFYAGRIIPKRESDNAVATEFVKTELFDPHSRYDYVGGSQVVMVISNFFLVLLRYPVELLFPAGLYAVLSPAPIWPYFGTWFVITFFLLLMGITFSRLMEVLETWGRVCFVGPQRLISIVVIAIGLLRLADVHYVSYLFVGGWRSGDTTIAFYLIYAYVIAWFYYFGSGIVLARRFLKALDPAVEPPEPIPFDFAGNRALTFIKNEGREIRLHGGGRLLVRGYYEDGYGPKWPRYAYTFLTPAQVLERMRRQAELRTQNASYLPNLRDFERATLSYPVIVSSLLYAMVLGTGFLFWGLSAQPPELEIVTGTDDHLNLDLAKLLDSPSAIRRKPDDPKNILAPALAADEESKCTPLDQNQPRIAIAASGGGTRAALYTASLLRGLAERDLICNVVLASGVSGGSAALAYFALNTDLRKPKSEFREKADWDKTWNKYEEVMARPYIGDVIDGASELSIAFGTRRWRVPVCSETSGKPDGNSGWARFRFGNLLAESFVCQFGNGSMAMVPFGLILNTGILGHYRPYEMKTDETTSRGATAGTTKDKVAETASDAGSASADDSDAKYASSIPIDPCSLKGEFREASSSTSTVGAGVRMSDAGGSSAASEATPTLDRRPLLDSRDKGSEKLAGDRLVITNLPSIDDAFIALNSRNVSVARAAALSANFPPVFANAAIDEYNKCGQARVRYWVTDGGTIDNRGVVPLYQALLDALPAATGPLPPLHVIVADVSAPHGSYSESWGVRSLLTAAGRANGRLEKNLLDRLKKAYGGEFHVYELTMPTLLRESIGTHWMLPSKLKFTVEDGTKILSDEAVRKIVRSLHAMEWDSDDSAVTAVRRQIEQETMLPESDEGMTHGVIWKKIEKALRPSTEQAAAAGSQRLPPR